MTLGMTPKAWTLKEKINKLSFIKIKNWGGGDIPGGPVIKNLPVNAGDTGSIPGLETKIPQCLRTPKPMLHSRRSHHNEKLAHRYGA